MMLFRNSRSHAGFQNLWPSLVVFCLVTAAFVAYVQSEKQIDQAHKKRHISFVLADQLRQSSDELTRMARTYVATGDPIYKTYYQDILDIRNGAKPQPEGYLVVYWDLVLGGAKLPQPEAGQPTALLDQFRQAGFAEAELHQLAKAKANSDALTAIEYEAMGLIESGGPDAFAKQAEASRMMHDAAYHLAKAAIMQPINEACVLMDKRTADAVHATAHKATLFRWVFIGSVLGTLFVLWRAYVTTRNNIEERKRVEESLRLTRVSIENASDAMFWMRPDASIADVNEAACRSLGYTRAELLGLNVPDVDAHYDAEKWPGHFAELRQRGSMVFESEQIRKDGKLFSVEVVANYVQFGEEEWNCAFVRDITMRKQDEAALRESEERWKFAIEGAGDGLWDWNIQTGKAYYSPRYKEMFGYADAEIGTTSDEWSKRIHPDDAPGVFARLKPYMEGKPGSATVEFRMLCKDGSWLWTLGRGMVVSRDTDGKPMRMIGTNTDITERKRADETLRKSQGLLEAAVANSPSGILIADAPDVRIRYANGAAFGIRGGNPLLLTDIEVSQHATKWQTFRLDGSPFPPEDLPLSRAVLKGLTTHDQEVIIRDEHGVDHWVIANAAPILDSKGKISAGIVLFHDITDRKNAEEEGLKLLTQLQQSQKMESLGTLAGGVAHDMNNVLGAILGLASAHIGTQPTGSPLHQALDTICKATERGGKMVKSLLSFARQTPVEENELDVNAILKEQISLLERTTLAKVRLEVDLEANLQPILGDASALAHAFMNLCVNAVDAMPENGTLTLHTRNIDTDWIEVVVEDNGTGMPKDVLEKAMDPFFTTKGVGKGTGLGLSMVFSSVKAHRGQMAIESEPGQGTRVRLGFPACKKEAQVAAPAVVEATLIPKGSMKVLLIDDDDLIQSSVQAILEVIGHTAVTTVSSGEEALAMLEAGFEPDLVILDMNMPGLGGIGTLPRLRGLRPAVPVLLATGRVDQKALTLASAHPGVTLLAKPFGRKELQKHLESIGLG